MANIRVRSKTSGKTGTLPEERFDPTKYERIEASRTAEDVGYAPGSLAGGAYDILGKILQTPLMRAGGQFMQGYGSLYGVPPEQGMPDIGAPRGPVEKGIRTAGAVTGIVNPEDIITKLMGRATTPLLGKGGQLLKEIPFGTPGRVQKGLAEILERTGAQIGKTVGASEATIGTGAILNKLDDLWLTYMKRGDPKKVKKITDVITKVKAMGDRPIAEIANEVATSLGEDIWGQAGRETLKRATGIAEKTAKKIAGGGLKEEVKKAVPKVVPMMEKFAATKGLEQEMQRPLKNWWMGGLAGAMTAPFAGLRSLPLGAIISAMAMPYTRLMGKKLGQEGVERLPPALAKILGLVSSKRNQ